MSNDLEFFGDLERIIDERMASQRPGSYVAKLAAAGERRVAQKLGEEAIELALAATAGNRDEQLQEAADLLFHLLVLLRVKNLRLVEVVNVLAERQRENRPSAP